MNAMLIVLLVAGGVACGALAEGSPRLVFDRVVYDFGKTGRVETVTGTFRFQNTGDGILRIKPPEPTCGCTVARLNPDTLAPGEEGELAFTLDLGRARATLEKHITVRSNDPETPETSLVIKADYTPLYDLEPMILSPSIPRNGRLTNLLVDLTRTDGKPLRIRKLEPSKPWISARLEPAGTGAQNKARIRVEVHSDGTPRRFSEFVHIYDPDQTNAPVTMIYVYGQMLGDLTVTPEALYWNIAEPAKVKAERSPDVVTRRALIRASDGKPFELRNGRSTLAGLQIEAKPAADGSGTEVIATLTDPPEQSLAGVVTFDTSVGSQNRVEVPFVVHVAKP